MRRGQYKLSEIIGLIGIWLNEEGSNYQFLVNLSIISKLDQETGKTNYALGFSFLWFLVKVTWL